MTALEASSISKDYPTRRGPLTVLRDCSLMLEPGESAAILGPSGSGKTTCLRIMSGLLHPTEGQVFDEGTPLRDTNDNVAMVFQNSGLLPWQNVFENIALGLKPFGLPEEQVCRMQSRSQSPTSLSATPITVRSSRSSSLRCASARRSGCAPG